MKILTPPKNRLTSLLLRFDTNQTKFISEGSHPRVHVKLLFFKITPFLVFQITQHAVITNSPKMLLPKTVLVV
jgi:hypothetical protein